MDMYTEDQENARTDENLTAHSRKTSSVSLDNVNDNNSTGLQSICSRSKFRELSSINPFIKESLKRGNQSENVNNSLFLSHIKFIFDIDVS